MDKYLMLIRHVLRESFNCLRKSNFDIELQEDYYALLFDEGGIFDPTEDPARGIKYHVTDVYLEEIYQVFGKEVK